MASRSLLTAASLLLLPLAAAAQSATQVVTFQVAPVRQIAVAGNPAPLVISSAVAGSPTLSVTTDGSSYAVTTNEANQKITASLDEAMPAGVTLEVTLAPPTGASGAGAVALSTGGSDVVTGIAPTSASGLPITYRLSATPAVQLSATTRTVTFTIVSGT